jgi:hypothetical protein
MLCIMSVDHLIPRELEAVCSLQSGTAHDDGTGASASCPFLIPLRVVKRD